LSNSAKTRLGQNVVKLRHLSGITQEKLAELAEIDRRYVQRIEGGTANPGVEVLTRLRIALNCNWDELLNRWSKPQNQSEHQKSLRRQELRRHENRPISSTWRPPGAWNKASKNRKDLASNELPIISFHFHPSL